MALCNQPKGFASDLGDYQSRYLLIEYTAKLVLDSTCYSTR